jgi:AraC-like DNA-binding protein
MKSFGFDKSNCREPCHPDDTCFPRIQDIARSLGFSVRSIQLQLNKDNTTFKDLLALIRKNMAESYLKNPSFSISDISYALGFSEPVSFHLAFKKWTGKRQEVIGNKTSDNTDSFALLIIAVIFILLYDGLMCYQHIRGSWGTSGG